MPTVTNLWLLRGRRHVSLAEMAMASGLSKQYINRAELSDITPTEQLEQRLTAAMETVIANRKQELLALEVDFRTYRGRLLELAEDKSHE